MGLPPAFNWFLASLLFVECPTAAFGGASPSEGSSLPGEIAEETTANEADGLFLWLSQLDKAYNSDSDFAAVPDDFLSLAVRKNNSLLDPDSEVGESLDIAMSLARACGTEEKWLNALSEASLASASSEARECVAALGAFAPDALDTAHGRELVRQCTWSLFAAGADTEGFILFRRLARTLGSNGLNQTFLRCASAVMVRKNGVDTIERLCALLSIFESAYQGRQSSSAAHACMSVVGSPLFPRKAQGADKVHDMAIHAALNLDPGNPIAAYKWAFGTATASPDGIDGEDLIRILQDAIQSDIGIVAPAAFHAILSRIFVCEGFDALAYAKENELALNAPDPFGHTRAFATETALIYAFKNSEDNSISIADIPEMFDPKNVALSDSNDLAFCIVDSLRNGGNDSETEFDILDTLLTQNPSSPEVLVRLGLSLIERGETAEAIRTLEIALENPTDNPADVWLGLAIAYGKAGEKDIMQAWFDKAVQAGAVKPNK